VIGNDISALLTDKSFAIADAAAVRATRLWRSFERPISVL
jgi:hypothetical protein